MSASPDIAVGIIFSQSGPYDLVGRSALEGALAAVAAINASGRYPFAFKAIVRDPQGDSRQYAAAAQDLIANHGCRHIIGTITSWSRKEVLPVVERAGALLWYAFPYEGYETSDHVLYLGATANQHIVPMFDYVLPRFGNRPFLIGSNYIWGWEVNRIARELVTASGGDPVGETYLPLGDTDVDHLIAAIAERRPDFVLSNLIGPSSHAFVSAYAALGRRDTAFAPDRRPIVSCNLSEVDIEVIGADAAGILATATYFDGANDPDGLVPDFSAATLRPSECFVAPYTALHILASCIARTGSDEPARVRAAAIAGGDFATAFGPIRFDANTGHCHLRPYLGRVGAGGRVDLLHRTPPIPPDPYLVRHVAERAALASPPPRQPFQLKVVN